MIRRSYFMAVKLKGSDVHASGIITVTSIFRPAADVVRGRAAKAIASACHLQVEDFVPVTFNRV